MTNHTDFSSAFAGLAELVEAIEHGATEGLKRAAGPLQADAQATSAYKGVTGATRASTVAYVASRHDDGSAAVDAALAAGEARNPGRATAQDAGDLGDDQIAVVLTAMMEYDADLETRRAGAQAFIAPAMDQHAAALLAAAGQGIAQELA